MHMHTYSVIKMNEAVLFAQWWTWPETIILSEVLERQMSSVFPPWWFLDVKKS